LGDTPVTADLLIRIGPLIGGVILMVICAVAILRNPAVSNVFAGLLAFGGLLFVIPALAFFNFKGLGIELSGQAATTGQVSEQAAGINARLEDIKTSLADLSRKVAPAAPPPPPPSAEFGANRSSTVIVVYPSDPKMKILAKQMENDLLKKGYLATSVFSDYSELSDAKKGTPGSVRYVFTDPAKAASIKQLLKPETTGLTALPDDQRQQMSADVQVLLF
jgi:hypothetical protein